VGLAYRITGLSKNRYSDSGDFTDVFVQFSVHLVNSWLRFDSCILTSNETVTCSADYSGLLMSKACS